MAKKPSAKAPSKGKSDLIKQLQESPTEENWKRARPRILKEGKYYFTFYPKGIRGSLSLKGAYVVIYDKRMKSLYNVPIVRRAGKGVEGATWYLKGLSINRSVIKS
jgi:hypothetical protein